MSHTVQDGLANNQVPFEAISSIAAHASDGWRLSPQVMFVFLENGPDRWSLDGCRVEQIDAHTGTSKHEMTLFIAARGDEWSCRWEYATDLFTDLEIRELAEDWVRLLGEMVAGPEQRVGELAGHTADFALAEPAEPVAPRSRLGESCHYASVPHWQSQCHLPWEQQIERIWCWLLQRPHAGPDESFFESGGHSLLAVSLVGEIHDQFGVMLPLSEFYRAPTIRGVAAALQRARTATSPKPSNPVFFLQNVQLDLSELTVPSRDVYALPFPSFTACPQSYRVEQLAADCLVRLKAVQPIGPYHSPATRCGFGRVPSGLPARGSG